MIGLSTGWLKKDHHKVPKNIKNTGNGMFPVTFLVEISGIEPLTS